MNAGQKLGKTHRIITWVLISMLVVFAGLQLNDPDPAVWVSIYAVCALAGISMLFYPVHWTVHALMAVVCVVGAVGLWPSEYEGLTGKMEGHPGVELARESLGLIICAGVLVYWAVLAWMQAKKSAVDS